MSPARADKLDARWLGDRDHHALAHPRNEDGFAPPGGYVTARLPTADEQITGRPPRRGVDRL